MLSDPEDWDKMVENNEDTQSLFEIKVDLTTIYQQEGMPWEKIVIKIFSLISLSRWCEVPFIRFQYIYLTFHGSLDQDFYQVEDIKTAIHDVRMKVGTTNNMYMITCDEWRVTCDRLHEAIIVHNHNQRLGRCDTSSSWEAELWAKTLIRLTSFFAPTKLSFFRIFEIIIFRIFENILFCILENILFLHNMKYAVSAYNDDINYCRWLLKMI